MLSPASSSSLFFFSASMTSCLVRPLTLYRLRLPSGPKPLLSTPRQRPPQCRWYLLSVQGAPS